MSRTIVVITGLHGMKSAIQAPQLPLQEVNRVQPLTSAVLGNIAFGYQGETSSLFLLK